MKNVKFAAFAIGAAILAAPAAYAGHEIFDPTVSSCTTLNCSSIVMGGTVMNAVGLTPARWEAAVYANAGECLRLDETAMFGAGADDEIVVVAPNGTVYRNDDFGGTLRPRVVVNPAPQRGWYYVSIARYNGLPTPEHDFHLAYGRYVGSTTNPNCTQATVGTVAPAAAKAAQPEMRQDAPRGSPTSDED